MRRTTRAPGALVSAALAVMRHCRGGWGWQRGRGSGEGLAVDRERDPLRLRRDAARSGGQVRGRRRDADLRRADGRRASRATTVCSRASRPTPASAGTRWRPARGRASTARRTTRSTAPARATSTTARRFATTAILQADTIQQAAERAGKKVVSVEWVGARDLVPAAAGPGRRLPHVLLEPRHPPQLRPGRAARAARTPSASRTSGSISTRPPAGRTCRRRFSPAHAGAAAW